MIPLIVCLYAGDEAGIVSKPAGCYLLVRYMNTSFTQQLIILRLYMNVDLPAADQAATRIPGHIYY